MGKWIYKRLKYWFSSLLEVLFEDQGVCYICGGNVDTPYPFCRTCKGFLPYLDEPRLNYKGVDLKNVYAIFSFEDKIRDMIYSLKYKGEVEHAAILGRVIAEFIEENNINADFIIPIPSHEDKIKTRGYNHINLIADVVGGITRIDVHKSLQKITNTGSQVLLSGSERWYNVRGSFKADLSYKGKRIILIDDLVTTGATAHFASRELDCEDVTLISLASTKRF
ncbi:MAG: ComF family protein [Clostridium sp.]|uniref:ComF family protein n=1 Tax=Clostridium sp. TaxID=1506 RepID=UPI002FC844AF